jgi:hypothetical protein
MGKHKLEGCSMTLLRRLLFSRVVPNLFAASVIQPLLTAIGIFTFLAGALYLPSLDPTRIQFIMGLLLLGVFALLCTSVGLLAKIVARLETRDEKHV